MGTLKDKPLGQPGVEREFLTADFDFDLPDELIAQHPTAERSASRLLDGTLKQPADRIFSDLPSLLDENDLLVFNDTQVIKARLLGYKPTGGAVEALVERILPNHEVWAHLRASKSPQAGSMVTFSNNQGEYFQAQMLGRAGPQEGLFHLRFPDDPLALLQQFGHVPLPPYITHSDSAEDESRYQTIFASKPGAVAAPTASLHFDEAVMSALKAKGIASASVTLHVGAGTFAPVRTEYLHQHSMHSEWMDVPQVTVDAITATRERGGRVVAAGTTTLRALESAARLGAHGLTACRTDTDIFIYPGFEFQVVDRLITNFHLPCSTLMMLVSAFAGYEHIMALYAHAIQSRYRFFSYGDAMLLTRQPG